MTRRGLFQMVAAAFVASRVPVKPPKMTPIEFMARAIKGALESMPRHTITAGSGAWVFDYGATKTVNLTSVIHHNYDCSTKRLS